MLIFFSLLAACGTDTLEDDAVSPCTDETRADLLEAGASFSGGTMALTVDLADPEIATAGENIWNITVTNDGAPATGCTFDAVTAMPDHGHGGPDPSFSEDGDGAYTMDVEFTMGGYWEIDVQTTCDDDVETIPVVVCAES